jgi:hypothetical protein
MAIHRRIRQAAKNALSAHRGRRARKVARPGKGRELVRDPEADRIDRRISGLAAEVLAGKHVECPWELFRVQHLPGWEHEDVAAALCAWSYAPRHQGDVGKLRGAHLPVIWACFGCGPPRRWSPLRRRPHLPLAVRFLRKGSCPSPAAPAVRRDCLDTLGKSFSSLHRRGTLRQGC